MPAAQTMPPALCLTSCSLVMHAQSRSQRASSQRRLLLGTADSASSGRKWWKERPLGEMGALPRRMLPSVPLPSRKLPRVLLPKLPRTLPLAAAGTDSRQASVA